MREKISAVVITKNEEKNIDRLLKSIDWVDEIILCDTGSLDNTMNIAQSFNCKVYSIEWKGFGIAKRTAVNYASHNWILSVDADEEVSAGLKNSILKILENLDHNCYFIKRESFYLEKKIKYCGWQNDYPKRLFDKRFGNFNDDPLHESLIIEGERGKITAPLYHYSYPDIFTHVSKMNHYTDLAAKKIMTKDMHSSFLKSLFFGITKFINMYIFRLGFLDGRVGLILCFNSAIGVYLKYIKVWKTKS